MIRAELTGFSMHTELIASGESPVGFLALLSSHRIFSFGEGRSPIETNYSLSVDEHLAISQNADSDGGNKLDCWAFGSNPLDSKQLE